ncbi:hypothetical protein ACWCQS_13870 [Streptomyces sp. NPDC002076]
MGPPAVLTTHFGVLLATRVLGAPADAGFLAVGLLSGPTRTPIARSVPGGPGSAVRAELRCRAGPGRS